VWLTHRSVLRRAGHNARSFLRSCRAQYVFYLEPHVIDERRRVADRIPNG
jgi:hypothetical protein